MKPKRLISLLVAVCMMITMLPLSAVTAFAAGSSWSHDPQANDGTYKYAYRVNADGETATITRFLGLVSSENNGSYDIEIPTELGGYPVTGLGENSFAVDSFDGYEGNPLCSKIHSVTIPQNVKSIGYRAFHNCDGLESLTINGAIESMGSQAFAWCTSLKTLKLGENIQTIGGWAFENCSSLKNVTIPESVTSIGRWAFSFCGLESLTINGAIESMGNEAFYHCENLKTLKLGEHIKTIGESAFQECSNLDNVTIPESVTSIYSCAFCSCTSLTTLSLGENIEAIYENAFNGCSNLSTITIPKKVTTIYSGTFEDCSKLESITLPAGLTSFQDSLNGCPADCVIYYKNYKAAADALLADNDANNYIGDNDKLRNRNFLYLCKVTFDANGGTLTNSAEVPVYKTEKITDTKANELTAIHDPTRPGYKFTGWYTEDGKLFDVSNTAIMEDTTFYAHWDKVPVCHPLTVTGGTATVEKDGQSLVIDPVVTGDKKTYSVPEGAEVTVTLDKTAVPNGKVFDGWSTGNLSLPTGQNYKAESITFSMSSDANVSAKYRDAATDHTPDTTVCHPLTLKDGVITSVTVPGKDGADPEDITEIVKKNANEDGSFNVPEGATVSVAFDKDAFADSGLKFGHWDITGLDDPNAYQDKESFDFVMPAKGVTLKAMTQDASIEDDEPDIVGPIVIGTTVVVGGAVLGYQAYSLGAEFAGKLLNLPYFPSNRSALAMMLWEDAGKPMPESELLYPDVGQEERDMDLQHAARWAMENELIPDLNDEGTAPEEMKFYPDNAVSKIDVLKAWQKAQELKQNA